MCIRDSHIRHHYLPRASTLGELNEAPREFRAYAGSDPAFQRFGKLFHSAPQCRPRNACRYPCNDSRYQRARRDLRVQLIADPVERPLSGRPPPQRTAFDVDCAAATQKCCTKTRLLDIRGTPQTPSTPIGGSSGGPAVDLRASFRRPVPHRESGLGVTGREHQSHPRQHRQPVVTRPIRPASWSIPGRQRPLCRRN